MFDDDDDDDDDDDESNFYTIGCLTNWSCKI